MSFLGMGRSALDYEPCRYGTSKLVFRGPKRPLLRGQVVCLGGSDTYGKFIAQPYPKLLERRLVGGVLNLGAINAGVDALLGDPGVLDLCGEAGCVILQVLGAQTLTNRLYSVHPRRNDRFVAASELLQMLYHDVDFTEFHFTRHMLGALRAHSEERFAVVRAELRQAWIARMETLLARIPVPVVLLWFSDHAPGAEMQEQNEPLFITRDMLDIVSGMADGFVEVTASAAAQEAGTEGMVFREAELRAARQILGPRAHEEAAAALESALKWL